MVVELGRGRKGERAVFINRRHLLGHGLVLCRVFQAHRELAGIYSFGIRWSDRFVLVVNESHGKGEGVARIVLRGHCRQAEGLNGDGLVLLSFRRLFLRVIGLCRRLLGLGVLRRRILLDLCQCKRAKVTGANLRDVAFGGEAITGQLLHVHVLGRDVGRLGRGRRPYVVGHGQVERLEVRGLDGLKPAQLLLEELEPNRHGAGGRLDFCGLAGLGIGGHEGHVV